MFRATTTSRSASAIASSNVEKLIPRRRGEGDDRRRAFVLGQLIGLEARGFETPDPLVREAVQEGVGRLEEVANLVAWLAMENTLITAQTIVVGSKSLYAPAQY